MTNDKCQVSGVRCQVSGVRCQVSGVRCQVSDSKRKRPRLHFSKAGNRDRLRSSQENLKWLTSGSYSGVSPLPVNFCCLNAAEPIRPPMPIDSTALLGTSMSAPFSFRPS